MSDEAEAAPGPAPEEPTTSGPGQPDAGGRSGDEPMRGKLDVGSRRERPSPRARDDKSGDGDSTKGDGEERPATPTVGSHINDRDRAASTLRRLRAMEDAVSDLGATSAVRAREGTFVVVGDVHFTAGDTVGGDKLGTPTTFVGRIAVGKVPQAQLEELRASFVAPQCYDELVERLRRNGLALLHTPSGWGRTATGLFLLAELSGTEVATLDPDTDLRGLDVSTLDADTGYLLEAWGPTQLADTTVPRLSRLATECRSRRIHLLITTEGISSLDRRYALHADFGVTGEPPDRSVVLRRHLTQRLFRDCGDPDAAATRATELLDRDEVRELVASQVPASLSMLRVAQLAERLAQVELGSRSFDAVHDYYAEQEADRFTKWFESQQDLAQHALVVALAVFNGMPYFTVGMAAHRLEHMFRRAEGGPRRERPPVFNVTRTDRLRKARAHVFSSVEEDEFGMRSVDCVRFDHAEYPQRLLRWVWDQHGDARHLVIRWLVELGESEDPGVRVRAATAAGYLATFDFDAVRRTVIEPWADSEGEQARESAVSALYLPSQQPELAAIVRKMVNSWVKDASPHRRGRRLVGIRAQGASAGQANRPAALDLLRGAAGDEDVEMLLAVCEAMFELFMGADERGSGEIVRTLVAWSDSPKQSVRRAVVQRRRTAVVCFVELAEDVRVPGEDGESWPALLWLAGRSDADFDRVVALWRRALNEPEVGQNARRVFKNWVRAAASSPAVLDELTRLGRAVAEAEWEGEVLRTLLAQMRDTRATTRRAREGAAAARHLYDSLERTTTP